MSHPYSVFIYYGYLQHARAGCPEKHYFRYLIYSIPENVELLDVIVFAFETGQSIVVDHDKEDVVEAQVMPYKIVIVVTKYTLPPFNMTSILQLLASDYLNRFI